MALLMRMAALCLITAILSGCALFRAVTFQSAPNSFHKEGSQTELRLYSANDCAKPSEVAVLPALAAIIVPQLVQAGVGALQNYLESKKKEFTASYNATANAPFYYVRREKEAEGKKEYDYNLRRFNCIRLTRTTKVEEEAKIAFDWVGTLLPNDSGTALELLTDPVSLSYAAARTDKKTSIIDVTVQIKVDATTLSDRGEIVTTTVAERTLSYPGVVIGKPVKKVRSSWFPAIPRTKAEMDKCNTYPMEETDGQPRPCLGVAAVNISIVVTETGSGGDAFGELGKQLGDSKKTIEDAIKKAVDDVLSPKASGGTSK